VNFLKIGKKSWKENEEVSVDAVMTQMKTTATSTIKVLIDQSWKLGGGLEQNGSFFPNWKF